MEGARTHGVILSGSQRLIPVDNDPTGQPEQRL